MTRLTVNVDHVATLRQARRGAQPDPLHAAVLAALAGAHGITAHLREDRRHVQDRDVEALRGAVHLPLNLEMACTDEMVRIAARVRPDLVTLVPERRAELTTEGGLDAAGQVPTLRAAAATLADAGVPVSLFVEAAPAQLTAAKAIGAAAVELHTGAYANAAGAARERELERLAAGAQAAAALGLRVHAGHGLHYGNVGAVAGLPEVVELAIGHAIVARAVLVGFERAVREMLDAIRDGATTRPRP